MESFFLLRPPLEQNACRGSFGRWEVLRLGGGFGHFYAYAPEKYEYPINRYAMEVKRQLDLLDKNLDAREYICGDEYNISDIAIHSWYGTLVLNNAYNASEFLEVRFL